MLFEDKPYIKRHPLEDTEKMIYKIILLSIVKMKCFFF